MLREIINFTQSLSPDSYKRGLQPAEGLHILVDLQENGELKEYRFEFFKKGAEVTKFVKTCLDRYVNTIWISSNKALDSKKKIHSCSPFCVAFKLQTLGEIPGRLDDYFTVAAQYCETDAQREWVTKFKSFSKQNILGKDEGILKMLFAQIEEENQTLDKKEQIKVKEGHYFYFYIANVPQEDYEQAYQNYVRQKAFNKEEFNTESNGTVFGVSDYLTGYNQKKPFLFHQSATFDLNSRVTNGEAICLFKFSQLIQNKQLPNPLPIFIDKEELNEKVVKLFHEKEGQRIGYAEIIRTLYTPHERDLGNYYLLNIQGKSVKDFDFVSSFQYVLEPPMQFENLFSIKNESMTSRTSDNIFDFERKIVQRIFDNQLVKKRDDGWWLRYFDDIDNKPQYIRPAMFRLVLRYRKAFYDYIYKSKREAISSGMFHDIMQISILDDLRQDQFKDNKHTKNFSIKEKLNIWFSLYEYFGSEDEKKGGQFMANRIRELQQRMKIVSTQKEEHIDSDDEFAFAAGQVIYYLLDQSEASNKSHALLEPFLQKTDTEQFKLAISRVFDRYKHAISFYKGKFEKLMAEVLGYETKTNLKSLMPMTLAGYFADCVIYQKTEKPAIAAAE